MVSHRSFPSELRNFPEPSTSLRCDNSCATHETLYLHSCSRYPEQRRVARIQMEFITGYVVASPRVFSRLTGVPIEEHISFWYVKDLMERQ